MVTYFVCWKQLHKFWTNYLFLARSCTYFSLCPINTYFFYKHKTEINNCRSKILFHLKITCLYWEWTLRENLLHGVIKSLFLFFFYYRPHLKLCFVSYSSNKIGNLFCKSLGQIPCRYTSNAVYKITCACGQAYIGQTCRRVPDRVRELKDALTKPSRFSHVAEHSKILDIVLIGLVSKSSLRTILPLNASLKKP